MFSMCVLFFSGFIILKKNEKERKLLTSRRDNCKETFLPKKTMDIIEAIIIKQKESKENEKRIKRSNGNSYANMKAIINKVTIDVIDGKMTIHTHV